MPKPSTDYVFAETPWSVFSVIRAGEGTRYTAAIELVYRQYLPAVYAWLRQRGFSQTEAEEIAQDFTTDKLFGSLLKGADSRIGKFRTLLLSALKNHVNDYFDHKRVRHPSRVAAILQNRGRDVSNAAVDRDADAEFDRWWALRTLEATLSAAEESFRNTDQRGMWDAFEQRVLLPIRTGRPRPTFAEVAMTCGLRDNRHAARIVTFVKRRCCDEFARQVAMVTEQREDFREELAYYRELLAMTGEGDIV